MKVEIGSNNFSEVHADDKKADGGAHHNYYVCNSNNSDEDSSLFAEIKFQKGLVKEAGINGCQNEDLLAIVLHRLQCFQEGYYSCRENSLALTKIEEAMHWLNHRTQARVNRGVEGTSVK